MPLELRRSFIATIGIATLVVVALCFWALRETVNAASVPAQLAFCTLLLTAPGGMFLLLHRLLPIALVKVWPTLDR